MKKFFISLFFACFLLNPSKTLAEGQVSLDLQPDPQPVDEKDRTIYRQAEKLLERYRHFEEAFPGEAIDGDIYPEVAKVYPYLGYQELEEKVEDIRSTIKMYRYFRKLYDDVKEKMLVPPPPPLIVDEKDYDTPYTGTYIESDSEQPVIINDFKKVLGYGINRQDFEAMELRYKMKMLASENQPDGFQKMGQLIGNLEWRKLFFYGIAYENPFSGRKGLGKWEETPQAKIRLISDEIVVDGKEIRTAVHFAMKPGYMLLWSPEKDIPAPEFDFSASENVEKAEVILPFPTRVVEKTDDNIMGYLGNFAIPVKITVKDISQPLKLKALAKTTFCGNNECFPAEAELSLELPVGESLVKSGLSSFIGKTYSALPRPALEDLKIVKAVVDDNFENRGQTLRVVLKSMENPEKVNIFLDSPDNISLTRPKITINGKEITVRFQARNVSDDLTDKDYVITAGVDGRTSLRQTVKSRKASVFDSERQTLTIGLIFLAFLGGFILNFMPCVFPVLSLKFLSLTKFGALKESHIRKNFAFTVVGIFIAFAFLTAVLLGLKALGIAVGWGMQFQNPYFLVAILYVMVLFMAQIFELINIKTPDFIVKKLNPDTYSEASDIFINILTGLFIVLVATPCTAPYLGTALGFALAGTAWDILAVMPVVALGLSLPYILLAVYPDLGFLMPKPGAWMQKLSRFMVLMLFLTIIWLLSILQAQTDWNATIWLFVLLVLFLLLLYMRHHILEVVDSQNEATEIRQAAAKLVKKTALVLFVIIIAFSFYKAEKAYQKHIEQVAQTREVKFDRSKIDEYLRDGNIVIVKVGADWCLTCKFNDVTVFNKNSLEAIADYYKVKFIEIDWTNYDKDVLAFMKQFGRSGLPFYIIFSRTVPDGMVLPEILTDEALSGIIRGFSS